VTTWTSEELEQIGRADELRIASLRPDGSLRPFVTIWVIRAGNELFIRSAEGPENGWYRRALASGSGRIKAGGVEKDVRFEQAADADGDAIDAVYHRKYDRYGPATVNPVVGPVAHAVTIRVIPG
jgi:hypothetical protein